MKRSALGLIALFASAAGLLLVADGGRMSGPEAAVLGDSWSPLTVTQGFALRLELAAPPTPASESQPEAAAGPRVMLRFVLRNVTSEPLFVDDSYPEHDYRLTVTDAAGKVIAPTGDASRVWQHSLLEVAAGKELTADYDLTRMYGPLTDGEYSILARRDVPRLDGEGMDQVESNPIAIVVSGGKAAVLADSWTPLSVTQGFALRLGLATACGARSVSRPEAAPGARVMLRFLRFALRNVTSEALLVDNAYPEHDYRLTVTDAAGEVIAPTGDASRVWARGVLEVAPGEELTADYDLTRMYGPLPDGEYSIVARRYVPRLDGEGMDQVESNPIAIAVSGGQTTQIASRPSGGGSSGATKGAGLELARGPDLLAARPILERHGFRVAWDAAKQAMTASKGKVVATIQAHKNVMVLGRQEAPMGKPARIVKGQLSAPGQAISMITSLGGGEAAA
jgi:hypothetical protein